ncbi:kinase-like domain-containing protein [Desarmillaria tabescens]|uniref:Kinase-like domain-containing protein n=1 Tax=Armillaria tabescens TaxID=1929756 RepID=A0AA39U3J9_ARMTA|nr:kinase-like domain-containing protein [Desarmillaria tabescens]KAK0466335.1 kinase-like domain-containing protein [Desarmillaria tabescens]
MPPQGSDLSKIPDIQTYLSGTPFDAVHIESLPGGYGNSTFRLHLAQVYKGQSTVILKHGKPYVGSGEGRLPFGLDRQASANFNTFEVRAMGWITSWLPEDSPVTVPRVHFFDDEANVIVMDDCGLGTVTLKKLFTDGNYSPAAAKMIGEALGHFIKLVHTNGNADKRILDLFKTNVQAKQISAYVTYGRLVSTLSGQDRLPALSDPPLDIEAKDLEVVKDVASKMQSEIMSAESSFVMGDFWPGNVLVSLDEDSNIKSISVIDRELAKTGLPGHDLGQFCAELRLLGHFYPTCALATYDMTHSFLKAYSPSKDIPLARYVITHMGAHLVAWTPRIPWGSNEKTKIVVKEGVGYIVGVDSDDEKLDKWFSETPIIALTTNR